MVQRLLPFLTLAVLFIGLAIASPHFLTSTNLSSVVRQTAVINIMALGMTLIIISGGIDLSSAPSSPWVDCLVACDGKGMSSCRRPCRILTGAFWGG
jgi:ribose/xylose/arabinose/galactoside ABC-type transport system permease subunit